MINQEEILENQTNLTEGVDNPISPVSVEEVDPKTQAQFEEYLDKTNPLRHANQSAVASITPEDDLDIDSAKIALESSVNPENRFMRASTNEEIDKERASAQTQAGNVFGAFKESARENWIKANSKVDANIKRKDAQRMYMLTGIDLEYESGEEYARLKDSDDPVVQQEVKRKSEEAARLRESLRDADPETVSKKQQDYIAKLALSRERQRAYISGIENQPVRVFTENVAPFIGGFADYVEFSKNIGYGALTTAAVAALGPTLGVPAAAIGTTTFLVDMGVGMLDNYVTAGFENDLGLENYTEADKIKLAAMGGAAMVGLKGAGKVASKYISPMFEKLKTNIAPKPMDNVKLAPPGGVTVDITDIATYATRAASEEINPNNVRLNVMDEHIGAPDGATQTIEFIIDPPLNEKGMIDHNPIPKEGGTIGPRNIEQIVDASGNITHYRAQTRYKSQDVYIEMPSTIEIDPDSPSAKIDALRKFQEAQTAKVYTVDADGNKVPLSGTDRVNAVRAYFVGEHTVKATEDNIAEKARRSQKIYNAERDKARVEGGMDAVNEIEAKITAADVASIQKAIEDGILSPIKTATDKADYEYYTQVGEAAADYQGNISVMVSAFENGQFANWMVNGVEIPDSKNGIHKLIKAYSDLDEMIFADSKSKMMQMNADDIVQKYGKVFSIDPNTGEAVISREFIEAMGGDLDAGIVDLSINRHLAIETDSHVSKYGFANPEDVVEALGTMVDPENINGSALKKTIEAIDDIAITKTLEDFGIIKTDDSGMHSLSTDDFLNGVKSLAEALSDPDITAEGTANLKKTIAALFDKEASPFSVKDAAGNVVEKLSVSDIILNQMDGNGTSYRATKQMLKPIEDAVLGAISKLDKDISVYKQTAEIAAGIRDMKEATKITNDIIADLMPDFRPRDVKGKSLDQIINGAIESDPKKAEAIFKSKRFKDSIEKLRDLNKKYGFIEDDSLLDRLDIDKLMEAEGSAKVSLDNTKSEFDAVARKSQEDIETKINEAIDSKVKELEELNIKKDESYETSLEEVTKAKVDELEGRRAEARKAKEAEFDALDEEIQSMLKAGTQEVDLDKVAELRTKLDEARAELEKIDTEVIAKEATEFDEAKAKAQYDTDVEAINKANEGMRKIYDAEVKKAEADYNKEMAKVENERAKKVKEMTKEEPSDPNAGKEAYERDVAKAKAYNDELEAKYNEAVKAGPQPKRRIIPEREQIKHEANVSELQDIIKQNPALYDALSDDVKAEIVAPKYPTKEEAKGVAAIEKDLTEGKIVKTSGFNKTLRLDGQDIKIDIPGGIYKSHADLMDLVKKQLPKKIRDVISAPDLSALATKLLRPDTFGLSNIKNKKGLTPEIEKFLVDKYGVEAVSAVKRGVVSKPKKAASKADIDKISNTVKKVENIIKKYGDIKAPTEVPKPKYIEIPEYDEAKYISAKGKKVAPTEEELRKLIPDPVKREVKAPEYQEIPTYKSENYSHIKSAPKIDPKEIKSRKAEINKRIKDIEKQIDTAENPKVEVDNVALGVIKRKKSIVGKELENFDSTYDDLIKTEVEKLKSQRNKEVFGKDKANKKAIQDSKNSINENIKKLKDDKKYIGNSIKGILKDIKKAKTLEDIKGLDLGNRIQKLKADAEQMGIQDIGLDIEKVMDSFVNFDNVSTSKNMTANEAMATVAQTLKSVLEKSKTLNEKTRVDKAKEVSGVKQAYRDLQAAMKGASKKDYSSIYEDPKVIKAMKKLEEIAKASGVGESLEDIIPKELMEFHGKILNRAKQSMEEGSIARPGERVRRANKNQVAKRTLKMARLSQMIDQSAYGNEKSMFNMADPGSMDPDFKIGKFLDDMDPTKGLAEVEGFDYKEFIRPDLLGEFENLYKISKEYFAEIQGADGEIRDLEINEFAMMYWDFLQDMGSTRGNVTKWDPDKKNTISSLIPYFKDEDAMVDFLTLDNRELGRTGFVKGNFDVLTKTLKGISNKGAEYSGIGMAKETYLGLLKNKNNPLFRDAVNKIEKTVGESGAGDLQTKYYNTFSDLVEAGLGTAEESNISKVMMKVFDTMYLDMLFGSGAKEYMQTAVWTSTNRAKYLGEDLDVGKLAATFGIEVPKAALQGLRGTAYHWKETIAGVKKMFDAMRGVSDFNAEISAENGLKSKIKHVNNALQRELKNLNSNRHLQNIEGSDRIRGAKGAGFSSMRDTAGNFKNYISDVAYYLQKHNEVNKNMRAHETSYEVMEAIMGADGIDSLKSNELKSTLKNIGVTDELFASVQALLRKNTDSDGAIDIDFVDFSNNKNFDMMDAKYAQIANRIYSAVHYGASTLNKASAFETKSKPLTMLIDRFLKTTTTGIGLQDVQMATKKIDDSGNYISRMKYAMESGSPLTMAKEAGKFGLWGLGLVGITGIATQVGQFSQNLSRKPTDLKKRVAEYWGKIQDKDVGEGDATSVANLIKNAITHNMQVGAANMPIVGGLFSGGNVFRDKITQGIDRIQKYMSTPDGEHALDKLAESMGIEDETIQRHMLKFAVTKTIFDMSGIINFHKGTIEGLKSFTEDAFTTENRRIKHRTQLDRNLKEGFNQKHQAKVFYEMLNINTDTLTSKMGAAINGAADSFLENKWIKPEDYAEMKNNSFEMMGANEKVYDKLPKKDIEYAEGAMDLLKIESDLDKNSFKFNYVQSIASGMSPRDVISQYLPGPPNGPDIAIKGKDAYTKEQILMHDELTKDYHIKEDEVPAILASHKSSKEIRSVVEKEYSPKSKEAKERASANEAFATTSEKMRDALDIIDMSGRGLFTPDYLESKGLNPDPNKVSSEEKAKALKEDYFDPLRKSIKNEQHVEQLYPLSVALGPNYVQNIYSKYNGDIDKTIDYIYRSRLKNRDDKGRLAMMVEICKGNYKDSRDAQLDDQVAMDYINTPDPQINYMDELLPEPYSGPGLQGEPARMDIEPTQEQPVQRENIRTIENRDEIISNILKDFEVQEGTGDKTGAAVTGDLGMTSAKKASLEEKYGKKLGDKEAAKIFIGELYDKVKSINPNLGEDSAKSIISTVYNLGEGALKWKDFDKYISNPTDKNLAEALFKRATIGGQTSKGLAKRRAEDYNKTNPQDPVIQVEQAKNGDLTYVTQSGENILIKATKGIHESSKPGIIELAQGKFEKASAKIKDIKEEISARELPKFNLDEAVVKPVADYFAVNSDKVVDGINEFAQSISQKVDDTVNTSSEKISQIVENLSINGMLENTDGLKDIVDNTSPEVLKEILESPEKVFEITKDDVKPSDMPIGPDREKIAEANAEIRNIISDKFKELLTRNSENLAKRAVEEGTYEKPIEQEEYTGVSKEELSRLVGDVTIGEKLSNKINELIVKNSEKIVERVTSNEDQAEPQIEPLEIVSKEDMGTIFENVSVSEKVVNKIKELISKNSENLAKRSLEESIYEAPEPDEIVGVSQEDTDRLLGTMKDSTIVETLKQGLGVLAIVDENLLKQMNKEDLFTKEEETKLEEAPVEEAEVTIYDRLDEIAKKYLPEKAAEGLRKLGGVEKVKNMAIGEAAYRIMSKITPSSEKGLDRMVDLASKSGYKVIPEKVAEKFIDKENLPKIAQLAIEELKNYNPHSGDDRIGDYLKAVGLKDAPNTTQWCAAFATFLAKEAGLKVKGTASSINFGRLNKNHVPLRESKPGDVLVQRHSQDGYTGHVNIVLYRDDKRIIAIGGNQTDPDKPYEIGVVNYKVYNLDELEKGGLALTTRLK